MCHRRQSYRQRLCPGRYVGGSYCRGYFGISGCLIRAGRIGNSRIAFVEIRSQREPNRVGRSTGHDARMKDDIRGRINIRRKRNLRCHLIDVRRRP